MTEPSRTASRAIVIFGATGDLALRMLFPALYFLENDNLLADDLMVIGSAPQPFTDAQFVERIAEDVKARAGEFFSPIVWARFQKTAAVRRRRRRRRPKL